MPIETPSIPAALSALPDPAPVRRRPRRLWTLLAVAVAVPLIAALASGFRTGLAWSRSGPTLALVSVDRGDVPLTVTEYGSLESADDEPVRCRVEALIGTVGGTQAG